MSLVTANTYNLNTGQKAAAEAFFQFLFSPDKEFIISGPAGVGKTFLMNYIIDNTMPRYHEMCKLMSIPIEYDEVAMTATTNKAAEVLSTSVKRPTSTIHSFLALRVFEDFTTGSNKLTKTNGWKVHENLILFIDEASMIDGALYNIIHEGTLNCKIVFVGDHNQLAPVTEKLSPVYKQGSPMYELTEQMRNSGQPALMEVCQQLRDTVETDIFNPIKVIPGVIDFLDVPQMEIELAREFSSQTISSRILSYTNKRVRQYNDYIRNLRKLPSNYMVGEILVNAGAFRKNDRTLSVEAEVEVLANYGPDSIKVGTDSNGDIMLDIEYLDIENNITGKFSKVMIPTDPSHFSALVKYYARVKNWERMFYLKNNFPDLRPRDAATVHKSQGSTYDSVFIDLEDISTCTHKDQTARMLYVAFSRARNRVFLHGPLAQKYGGLILP